MIRQRKLDHPRTRWRIGHENPPTTPVICARKATTITWEDDLKEERRESAQGCKGETRCGHDIHLQGRLREAVEQKESVIGSRATGGWQKWQDHTHRIAVEENVAAASLRNIQLSRNQNVSFSLPISLGRNIRPRFRQLLATSPVHPTLRFPSSEVVRQPLMLPSQMAAGMEASAQMAPLRATARRRESEVPSSETTSRKDGMRTRTPEREVEQSGSKVSDAVDTRRRAF